MGKQCAPIYVKVYGPETEEGKRELAKRVADVHGDLVHDYLQKLNCPWEEKLELLEWIIAEVKIKQMAGPVQNDGSL